MRTTRAAGLAFVVFAALVGGAATGCSPRVTPPNPLVGAWRSKVQFKDGAFSSLKDLEFLYVFNAGGTMTESSNYDGAPPVPPAYGVWRESSPAQIEATYTFYNTRAPADIQALMRGGWLPAGRGVLRERITLSGTGQSFDSAIRLSMEGQSGESVDGGSATGHGVRVDFQ